MVEQAASVEDCRVIKGQAEDGQIVLRLTVEEFEDIRKAMDRTVKARSYMRNYKTSKLADQGQTVKSKRGAKRKLPIKLEMGG